jgi:hypothetical protein
MDSQQQRSDAIWGGRTAVRCREDSRDQALEYGKVFHLASHLPQEAVNERTDRCALELQFCFKSLGKTFKVRRHVNSKITSADLQMRKGGSDDAYGFEITEFHPFEVVPRDI